MDTPRRILVATDFSANADQAVQRAIDLARPLAAEVFVLHVCAPVSPVLTARGLMMDVQALAANEDAAERRLEAEARQGADLHITPVVEVGEPATEIVRTAERLHADMIITGSHGRRGLSHALLGSVAASVLGRAPCPVLIVRSREPAQPHPSHSER